MKFALNMATNSNKLRRGWIIRILNYFANEKTRVCNDKLIQDGLQEVGHQVQTSVLHSDLRYLHEKGYLIATEPEGSAFAMLVAEITAKGVDLYEGTIDDPGIDFGHDD